MKTSTYPLCFLLAAALVVLHPVVGPASESRAAGGPSTSAQPALPRLLDLGAAKCIPCKMMAPILDELKREYAGKLEVEFVDVWLTPDAGKKYRVALIPTQIFFDAGGKELFRHEGFYAKKAILEKWKEMGVDLIATAH